ncbi:MAG: M20/M25/M40 family metallo-hydrolase [Gemmatimonadota bacterium]|nr:MAG: M20/M25/M40 family metallo-hydrolase [Gemmatimonadota bacterium]
MKLHILVVLAVYVAAACAPEPEISSADVERILSVLSGDSMGGRDILTPGIAKAESFIQSEFADIGLETLEGLEGFAQTFPVHSLTAKSQKIELNGSVIPEDRVAAAVSQQSIRWMSPDDVNIVVVGSDDDLREQFFALRGRDGNTLVLVHDSHQQFFDGVRMFLSRPRYVLGLNGSNMVMVLTRQASIDSLSVELESELSTESLTNVVGVIPGRRSEEIVLFSAHHDHLGIGRPVDGDSIYNGANDDASGTTAVIALARYLEQSGKPERTLMFATFTAEESGGFGSQYLSQQLDPDQVVAMFNIEMIGKPGVENPDLVWITGFNETDFGEILQQGLATDTGYTFGPDPYPDQGLFYRSDNAVFARLGVPAHSISTTSMDSDEDYHRPSDEIETLHIEHMMRTIEAIALGAGPIISGRATPTRVDPENLN